MNQGIKHVSTGHFPSREADDPSRRNETDKPAPEGGPAPLRILFLDDDPERARAFLLRRPEAVWVQTAEECIARLEETWDQVHLDHDLGGEVFVDSNRPDCGMEVVRWLCGVPSARFHNTIFIIHTYNADAGDVMVTCLCSSNYQAVYRPFGVDLIEFLAEDDEEEEEGKGKEEEEEKPVHPAKRSLSRWIGGLARRLRPGSRSEEPGHAAEESAADRERTEDPFPDEAD